VLANAKPTMWNEIWSEYETTSEERAFFKDMLNAGFENGVALPLYGPNLRNACVCLGHLTEKADLSPANLTLMQFAAQAAHLRICAIFGEELSLERQLSRREKEILDWVARGKSNSVIADILAISTGTVDTYMRRIYEKLEVSDRTSAAVKGVGMGLIAA
jgi:DNA-binding CsgD family transcriptional regulator